MPLFGILKSHPLNADRSLEEAELQRSECCQDQRGQSRGGTVEMIQQVSGYPLDLLIFPHFTGRSTNDTEPNGVVSIPV